MSRPPSLALAVLCFACASATGVAGAQPIQPELTEALDAYRAGELDAAVVLFERALGAAGNGPAQLGEIYLHIGILRASLGEPDAAQRAFEIALALQPDLTLPPVLAPAQQASFEAARLSRGGAQLELGVRAAPLAPEPPSIAIELSVSSAPEGLVAAYVVRSASSEPPWSERLDGASGTIIVPVSLFPEGRPIVLEVDALDAHGGVLARRETSARLPSPAPEAPLEVPIAALAPSAVVEASSGPASLGDELIASPWLWVVVGALALGGVIAGVVIGTSEDRYVVGAPIGP